MILRIIFIFFTLLTSDVSVRLATPLPPQLMTKVSAWL